MHSERQSFGGSFGLGGRDERSSMEVLDWEWLFFDYAHHGLWSINIVELEGREKKKEQTEAKWVSTLVIRSPYLLPTTISS